VFNGDGVLWGCVILAKARIHFDFDSTLTTQH
jgi:hypothetical protein